MAKGNYNDAELELQKADATLAITTNKNEFQRIKAQLS